RVALRPLRPGGTRIALQTLRAGRAGRAGRTRSTGVTFGARRTGRTWGTRLVPVERVLCRATRLAGSGIDHADRTARLRIATVDHATAIRNRRVRNARQERQRHSTYS